ncbi:hypothetical protein ACQF4J_47150 (plasmid) [Streptomyces sp. C1-1]|uniref:hypothetical protein n=1 Tax=Streptomyces sp. C1-1 TaxID=3231173 RepID=UPI003D07853A
MTDTHRPPPPPGLAQHLHPFAADPGRWEKEHARALRTAHVHTCTADCEPVLVYERTGWGWLAWTIPGDGSRPEVAHEIGVLTPSATRAHRLALRWLTRRPACRIDLFPGTRASLRLVTFTIAFCSLIAGLFAMAHGIPADVVLPAIALPPLLAEHVPATLDARTRHHVRSVQEASACRYLQRLAAWHTCLLQAAAGSDRYELRRSAEVGQQLLWDAAGLLQTHDARSVSCELIARERLMLQLADQVAQILGHASVQARPDHADQACTPSRPPGTRSTTGPALHKPGPSPLEGALGMPELDTAARTATVYLLFAHEPYYPGPGVQEINTTLVAADTLLHPRILQSDGTRIHALLTQGRQPGEIVPLATLTHELNGGADWPAVGDWERVTVDLVHLVQTERCDALSLQLPEVARALICTGPNSQVRAFDAAAGEAIVYGPDERTKVLTEVGTSLTGLTAEQPFWPGDGLLPPLCQRA